MLQICPYSGEQFKPRRKNQVFASPLNRRNFHNEIAADQRRIKAPIDKHLEKNFAILSELIKSGETKKLPKQMLKEKGFNAFYFTHLDEYKNELVRCLYHFVFIPNEDDNFITIAYPKK